jgi:hypothetical protein
VLGIVSSTIYIARAPTRLPMALTGLAEHAAFSLAGGLAMRAVAALLAAGPADLAFSIAVLAGFVTAWLLNVAITFSVGAALDGLPFWETIRRVIVPLLPSEAAMVLLASIIVYAEAQLGVVALAMLVALLFLYLFLLRELVTSQRRAEELEQRTEQLASLTSASSSCPTTSSARTRSSPTRTGSSSACTPTRARASSARSRATGRSPTSSGATTSGSTARATRAALPATTSRSSRG